jgi:hypothetical protein
MNLKEISKLKFIKEVYGDKFEQLCPDDNGWITYNAFETDASKKQPEGSIEKRDVQGHPAKFYWRDVRLKNIENNNGWTRTDENFPTKSGIYVFLSKGKISHEIHLRFPLLKEEENHYRNDFTHFRIPEDYPLPIF